MQSDAGGTGRAAGAGRPGSAHRRRARRISPLYQVLLNNPAVTEGWEAMLTAIRQKTALAPRLRELIILRVATLNGAPYEFEAHVPHARQAGMPDALIERLRARPSAGGAGGRVGGAGAGRGRGAGADRRHDARHRGVGRGVRAAARCMTTRRWWN